MDHQAVSRPAYPRVLSTLGREGLWIYFNTRITVSYPSLCYTTEGKMLRDRLWEETLEEFYFANA